MANVRQLVTEHIDVWTSAIEKKSATGRGSKKKIRLQGVQKLRELILELAVRGKLVPQDPNDEAASQLLERTIAEKKKLVKEKIIRKTKIPVISSKEGNSNLPSSWVLTTLYEIGEIGPRNDADDEIDSSFVPMQLISEKYGIPVEHEVKQWSEIKSGFTHFQEEDVVLAKITPCFQNGKSAVMRGLTEKFGAGTTELHVFRKLNQSVVPEYVLIYLKSPGFILEGIPKMTGTAGQKRITRDYFAGNPFPMPPLAEQHRIVAKVDELMSLCNQLEQQTENSIAAHQTLVETLLTTLTNSANAEELQQNWARIETHFDTLFTTEHSIDQLKQTILQLAVMGKLVPQEPNDEPASVLLGKIAEEKERLIKEGKIKKQKALQEIEDKEFLFDLPDGWMWERLGRLAVLSGGFAYKSTGFIQSGKHQVIRMGNIRPDHLRLDENSVFLTEEIGVETSDYQIYKDDILLTMTGTKGKRDYLYSLIVLSEHLNDRKLYLNQRLCLVKNLLLVPEFLNMVIKANNLLDAIYAQSTGTANQANIGMVALNNWVLPIPPTEEQHRIVVKIDELMALCDSLKARITEAQTTQLHLANAIVEQAVS